MSRFLNITLLWALMLLFTGNLIGLDKIALVIGNSRYSQVPLLPILQPPEAWQRMEMAGIAPLQKV